MFSDPIKKNQNFDGLIFLDKGTSLEFSVTGNIIKAFPASRQNGECKITIREGLVNILGYKLKADYVSDLTFEVPKPAVRLTGKGVILPSSKGMVFPFEAVNLNAVDVKIIKIFENNIGHFLQVNRLDGSNELKRAGRLIHKEKIELGNAPADLTRWNRFYLDLAKLIEPDPGAIYRIEISFGNAIPFILARNRRQKKRMLRKKMRMNRKQRLLTGILMKNIMMNITTIMIGL